MFDVIMVLSILAHGKIGYVYCKIILIQINVKIRKIKLKKENKKGNKI